MANKFFEPAKLSAPQTNIFIEIHLRSKCRQKCINLVCALHTRLRLFFKTIIYNSSFFDFLSSF